MTMGFKGQQSQQIVHRVIQVRAIGRGGAVGDHPQALQAHHMVNAQAAGMGEVGPQHVDESAETIADQAFGENAEMPQP